MHDLGERVAVVHRHELAAEGVVRCVEREREPDRLLDLVREPPEPRQPADRRDRRTAVGDAELRESARGCDDGVQVQHRLAHAHEDAVVERLDSPEVKRLVEHLRRGQVAREAHLSRRAERAGERAA